MELMSIITGGFDFPQRLVLGGFNAPDPRCEEHTLSSDIILGGFLNEGEDQNIVTQGLFSTLSDLLPHLTLEFDSYIYGYLVFDSAIDFKDGFILKYDHWV
jgi:hypothetical protein